MLTILLSLIGFLYERLKTHAVGAFVALYCLSKLRASRLQLRPR